MLSCSNQSPLRDRERRNRRRLKSMRSNVTAYFGATFALILVLGREYIVHAEPNAVLKTQIVLLATGTPGPDPERFGPATAIVANGNAYLVDFGQGIVPPAAAPPHKGTA